MPGTSSGVRDFARGPLKPFMQVNQFYQIFQKCSILVVQCYRVQASPALLPTQMISGEHTIEELACTQTAFPTRSQLAFPRDSSRGRLSQTAVDHDLEPDRPAASNGGGRIHRRAEGLRRWSRQERTGQGLARGRPEPAGIDPPPPSHHHPPALRQPGRDRPARAERSPRRGRGRARGVADAGPSERARRHRPRPGRTRTGRRRLGCAPRSPHAVRLDGP
jgi:hypothetical protein